jgi:hypothetical protein
MKRHLPFALMGTILYDTGHASLWLRIPILTVGLFTFYLGVQLAAFGLFGVDMPGMSDVHGSPLLGSLACFPLAALFIYIWFAQLRILFDATRNELIVSSRGYLRWHEHRISLTDGRKFHIQRVYRLRGNWNWEISVEFADGRIEQVIEITSGMVPFAELLERATKLPVMKHE